MLDILSILSYIKILKYVFVPKFQINEILNLKMPEIVPEEMDLQ